MLPRSELDRLEETGQWPQALAMLKHQLEAGVVMDADHWHRLGRLYQRLGLLPKAERAYLSSLRMDPSRPLTCNNLALLFLNRLLPAEADQWLMKGLASARTPQERDLLHATGCALRLFQLRHADALAFADRQLSIEETVMARSNRASCLHRLGRLEEAARDQERAIRLHLKKHAPQWQSACLPSLVGVAIADLQERCILQVMLMTHGIFQLCLQPGDPEGTQLLLAGQAADPAYWLNPARSGTRWDGSETPELLVWDDQGFGDTLQNLAWIPQLADRVKRLRLWLRPALIPLVAKRFPLPDHCVVEPMGSESEPWAQGVPQVGTYYLPIVMKAWSQQARDGGLAFLQRHQSLQHRAAPRIGLVWSAGRHKAPQPERSARVRDVPLQAFFLLAEQWRQRHQARLLSLQLEGHADEPVQGLIQKGVLEQPLRSPDWLETAEVLETLDLLVTVDTSVAHLAGALGVPTVLLLSCPADWRWGQHGEHTFLYRCMHLARCAVPGDWSQALSQADHHVGALCRAMGLDGEWAG
ncbi:tetratricopeptide repeat-containing glycosyltransferase family protein [Synechococcus sp. BS55D]|uniref:tetratricopeptide repeat-containing glycosyltransferase family protein n=1 Tax=Synechococcus sp. BS55D TaxID=2055943 RepID=UPI0010401AAA|nr:tetratricopeptide repeat-containing glycosyltransferase family protein [Synechococcus sp. BS55D]TCD58131.1 hypothetical protein CWE16_02190 [Synechococcus sp. BS55D]